MSLPLLIETPAQLADLAGRLTHAEWLAVDTEFVRVDTYFPRLCLVQVSDGTHTACVDMLAIAEPEPLLALLRDGKILKVLHAASQDLEILLQLKGRVPAPIFDTQIAATLLGIGDQIGYAGLVEKRLGVAVDKSLARTDWARRPIVPEALAYAADDVRHLAQLYPALRAELEARGRLAWLDEDCARLVNPALYETHPEDAWRRLKGIARLAPAEQAVAARLAAWRETEAIARNRPRKWILDDPPIYQLAQRRPQTATELEALKVLPPKTLARNGEKLVALIRQSADAAFVPVAAEEIMSAEQKARFKRLQDAVLGRATALGLPAGYLAPRADLLRLLREGERAEIALLRGWRHEQAGEELLKLL